MDVMSEYSLKEQFEYKGKTLCAVKVTKEPYNEDYYNGYIKVGDTNSPVIYELVKKLASETTFVYVGDEKPFLPKGHWIKYKGVKEFEDGGKIVYQKHSGIRNKLKEIIKQCKEGVK